MRVGQRILRAELRTRQALERRRHVDVPRQRIRDLSLDLRLEWRPRVAELIVRGSLRPPARCSDQAEVVDQVAVVDPLAADADAAREKRPLPEPRVDVEVEAVVDVVDAADLARVEDQVVRRDDRG